MILVKWDDETLTKTSYPLRSGDPRGDAVCYWKWPLKVDYPRQNGGFHSYVKLPDGIFSDYIVNVKQNKVPLRNYFLLSQCPFRVLGYVSFKEWIFLQSVIFGTPMGMVGQGSPMGYLHPKILWFSIISHTPLPRISSLAGTRFQQTQVYLLKSYIQWCKTYPLII